MANPTIRTVAAFAVAVLLIGLVELGYRATGGTPALRPGYAPVELRWRVQQTPPERAVYVVGDSRVGWGFSERAFDRAFEGRQRTGVNVSLPAGSISRIFEWLLEEWSGHRDGVVVLALSPAGLYSFEEGPGPSHEEVKRQDLLDEQISLALGEYLFTYGRQPPSLLEHFRGWAIRGRRESIYWSERVLSPDGLAYGRRRSTSGERVDPAEAELIGYRRLLPRIFADADETLRTRREIVRLVKDARRRGWQVAIARFPLGPRLLDMENSFPPALLPAAIANDAGTPFFDYTQGPRVRGLATHDESHLTPDAAAELSRLLAADVAGRLRVSPTEPASTQTFFIPSRICSRLTP